MKTKNLFFGALTCLAFAACSDDDNAVQNPQSEGVVDRSYLAVQLSIPGLPGATTRADHNYAEADPAELKVNDVAFFFFDNSGESAADPCYVEINENYEFWTGITDDHKNSHSNADNTDNKESNIVLVVKNAQADLSQVVAILNPTEQVKQAAKYNRTSFESVDAEDQVNVEHGKNWTTDKTLSWLQNRIISNSSIDDGNNDDGDDLGTNSEYIIPVIKSVAENGSLTFEDDYKGSLMSNSVYYPENATGSNSPYTATQVDKSVYFKDSEPEALATPLIIHVERVEARVSVIPPTKNIKTITDAEEGSETTTSRTLYQLKRDATTDVTLNNSQLYFELKGWWLNNTMEDAYLLKQLPTYNAAWNDHENYRSYWANAWNYTLKAHKKFNDPHTMYDKYCLENTADDDNDESGKWTYNDITSGTNEGIKVTKATQVVVAGQIVNENGVSQNVVSYNNAYYIDTDFLNKVAESLTQDGYRKLNNSAESNITSADLELNVPKYLDSNSDGTYEDDTALRDYEAKVNLKSLESGATYVKAGETTDATTEIKANLTAVYGNVKYWKDGNTYFFTRVKHDYNAAGQTLSGNDPTTSAVIRNHWYKVNISGFYGLGTPVPNPDIPIIPVTPEDDKVSYMACKIAVLKYRTVSQDVTLGGTNAKDEQ